MKARFVVAPEIRSLVPAKVLARLKQRTARAQKAAGVAKHGLSVLLTSDAEIHLLNRRYRKINRPTDVLSFSQNEGMPILGEDHLGDIVISVETARRRRKRTLEEEIFQLLVHGLVHLLGLDHTTRNEARRMFALERNIRTRSTKKGS